ncbi:kinase-like protein [Lentinus brumalis]|uniref:Kinase-like protein n=1 Tax=Lentinus brumalis TaxID=2498619 RepID=A0A371CJA8_9APHY|nr:kinase-like protein [Polyporus brumalis]
MFSSPTTVFNASAEPSTQKTNVTAAAPKGLYQSYDVDLRSVLHKGAFATVATALHRRENKWYAVKIFAADKLRHLLKITDPGQSEQRMEAKLAAHLAREVQILQGLRHLYVCEIKEAFLEGYSISIVLDLAHGGNLMSYVLKHEVPVLLEPEGQYFAYQICDALKYIHSQGIAHWNLKPENVLLTEDGPPMVKLADFGLVKVIDCLSELQTRCRSQAFVTPTVLDDSTGDYDKLVDSWTFGVMMFTLFTMATPFTDTSIEPHRKLLEDYNISNAGVEFICLLLSYKPCARMAPSQALDHRWIIDEGPKQRARLIEREELSRRQAARRQPTPTAQEGKPQSNKRNISVLQPEKAFTGMSAADEESQGAKRTRGNQDTIIRRTPPATLWSSFDVDSDEIPGLVLSHR